MEAGGLFGFGDECVFQMLGVALHFARGDLLFRGADEAEFADGDSLFCTNRRAEDAARHGAMGVKVAGAGDGIERGTRFVVAVVFEGREGFRVVAKDAGGWVAWKVGSEARDGVGDALMDAGRASGVVAVEFGESGAESGGVELRDLEDADAALGAADAAREMGSALGDGEGEFGVDDLDETLVACRNGHEGHSNARINPRSSTLRGKALFGVFATGG